MGNDLDDPLNVLDLYQFFNPMSLPLLKWDNIVHSLGSPLSATIFSLQWFEQFRLNKTAAKIEVVENNILLNSSVSAFFVR